MLTCSELYLCDFSPYSSYTQVLPVLYSTEKHASVQQPQKQEKLALVHCQSMCPNIAGIRNFFLSYSFLTFWW